MKKQFSTSWISSKQPRKQRKYRHNAPLHVRSSFLHVKLSDDMATKNKLNRTRVRVGDKVKIQRGKFKGMEGKVDVINVKKATAKIVGAEITKKDGSKVKVPIHVSNLLIVDLNMDDKKRFTKKTDAAAKASKQ